MPGIRQEVACEKATRVAIITASMKIATGEWDIKKADDFCISRYKEIKRKYGYGLFIHVSKRIIKNIEYHKQITTNLGEGTQKVNLRYNSIIEGINKDD
ncbi:MAG: hypothetical protein ACFFG0_02455 [Candidatus Thorarchaeota archaeon]